MEEQQALHVTQRLVYHNRQAFEMDRVLFSAAGNMYRREGALAVSYTHLFGITIHIKHAHSNQYQVILPDGSEIFRIIDRVNRKLSVLTI